MKVLVLGGTGLIGAAIVRRFLQGDAAVIGLARDVEQASRVQPRAEWVSADLSAMTGPADWAELIEGVDCIVNAAGALQDGGLDKLELTHAKAVVALVGAAEQAKISHFVQISAPGAVRDASTKFYRTKAVGDQALKTSSLPWTILRPGLVLGRNAFGGSRLLRMLAAFPYMQPLAMADARIQTVALDYVVDAVHQAVLERLNGDFDLVEDRAQPLSEVVRAQRRWLGFPAARFELNFGPVSRSLCTAIADQLGRFGWRSPLRSTAVKVLEDGVVGDASAWRAVGGQRMRSLDETLEAMEATHQDRLAARAMLLFPVLVAVLAAFWLISGIIGAWRLDAAKDVLPDWIPDIWKAALVLGGAALDIVVGAAIMRRKWLRAGLIASAFTALAYLASATVLTPHLWADPLGPLIKVFPAIALAAAIWAMAEER